MNLETVNGCEIYYDDKWLNSNLEEYRNFILTEIKNSFNNVSSPISVNFACNLKKDINIDFQYEHTIILEGNQYICKIHNYDYLNTMDYVLEYSNANIEHSKRCNISPEYLNKLIYFPPLIYELSDDGERTKNIITIHNSNQRRHHIHNQIEMDYFHNIVGYNVFDKNKIKSVLDNYKILVNIHQLDIHHTLEELRVLPSLLTGILIISEEVPYKEVIPYSKHIIWSTYDNLPNKINEVLLNYDEYREKYLNGLNETITNMKNDLNKNKIKIINNGKY